MITVPDWQHADPWIWDSAVALGNQCFKQGNDFCSYSGKKLHEEEHSSIKTNSTSFAETKHPEFKSFPDANFHHNSQAWCQYFYSACFWTRKNKEINKKMPFHHVSGNVHHLFSIHFSLLWCWDYCLEPTAGYHTDSWQTNPCTHWRKPACTGLQNLAYILCSTAVQQHKPNP